MLGLNSAQFVMFGWGQKEPSGGYSLGHNINPDPVIAVCYSYSSRHDGFLHLDKRYDSNGPAGVREARYTVTCK